MDIEASQRRSSLARRSRAGRRRFYRHRLPVRVMHWINVVCLTILLMSGLNIFNAHPALYWGQTRQLRAALALARRARTRRPAPVGTTHDRRPRVRHHRRARPVEGRRPADRARLPELGDDPRPAVAGDGAPLALVLRLAVRDQRHAATCSTRSSAGTSCATCVPTRLELQEHRPLDRRPPASSSTRPAKPRERYNVLQSLTYLIVIFVLLPLVVLAGMAMSPRLDSVFTGWVDLFGGRQSARSLHFLAAWAGRCSCWSTSSR